MSKEIKEWLKENNQVPVKVSGIKGDIQSNDGFRENLFVYEIETKNNKIIELELSWNSSSSKKTVRHISTKGKLRTVQRYIK